MRTPDDNLLPETKAAYISALKDRGNSYIEAAKLIINNSNFSDPEKSDKLKPILAIEHVWQRKRKRNCTKQDFHDLQLHLLAALFYDNNVSKALADKKNLEAKHTELNTAEVLVNWEKKIGPITGKGPVNIGEGVVATTTETPIELAQNDLDYLKKSVETHQNNSHRFFEWEANWLLTKLDPNHPEELLSHGPPSTIRKYAGVLANAFTHTLKVEANGKQEEFTNLRSSIVVPYGIKDDKEAKEATKQSIMQLYYTYEKFRLSYNQQHEKSPGKQIKAPDFFLIQTLITPLPGKQPGDIGAETRMQRILNAAVKELNAEGGFFKNNNIELLVSNRPLNSFRIPSVVANKLFATETHGNTEKTANALTSAVLTSIDEKMTKYPPKTAGFLEPIKLKLQGKPVEEQALKTALDNIGTYNPRDRMMFEACIRLPESMKDPNKNLHTAAYEQIITMCLSGIATGSCKSGKDRKGLAEIVSDTHIAAALSRHGRLLDLSDKDDVSMFNKIFKKFFDTDISQQVAETNGQGCRGLKSVPGVLGKSKEILSEDELMREKLISALNKTKTDAIKKPGIFSQNLSTVQGAQIDIIDTNMAKSSSSDSLASTQNRENEQGSVNISNPPSPRQGIGDNKNASENQTLLFSQKSATRSRSNAITDKPELLDDSIAATRSRSNAVTEDDKPEIPNQSPAQTSKRPQNPGS